MKTIQGLVFVRLFTWIRRGSRQSQDAKWHCQHSVLRTTAWPKWFKILSVQKTQSSSSYNYKSCVCYVGVAEDTVETCHIHYLPILELCKLEQRFYQAAQKRSNFALAGKYSASSTYKRTYYGD